MIIVTLNVSQPNQTSESESHSFPTVIPAPNVKPRMQGNQYYQSRHFV